MAVAAADAVVSAADAVVAPVSVVAAVVSEEPPEGVSEVAVVALESMAIRKTRK